MLRRVGVTAVCAAIAIIIACLRLLAPVPIEVLDRKLLDFRHLARGPIAAGPDVVIVAIDEASLAKVGRWPWPRARIADLVDRLADAGVSAIGFDVVFDQPVSTVDRQALESALDADPHRSPAALRQLLEGELNDDARLEASLRRAGRVVLAHFFEFGGAADARTGDDDGASSRAHRAAYGRRGRPTRFRGSRARRVPVWRSRRCVRRRRAQGTSTSRPTPTASTVARR